MEIAKVRAEIKSWERAFRAESLRDPTVDDIKANHQIAAKYKLYKKLSKVASNTSKSASGLPHAPTTPPRRSSALPGPSSLLPKSLPAPGYIDSTTPNPFSPSKKQHVKFISPNEAPLGMPNFVRAPSTPPSKRRGSSSKALPQLDHSSEMHEDFKNNVLNSTVKRAKKRLHGDVVSPSPKKRRIISTRHDNNSDSGDSDTAYVTDSPVKAKSTGKDFKPIFEDDKLSKPNFLGDILSQSTSIFTSNTKRSTANIKGTLTDQGRNKSSKILSGALEMGKQTHDVRESRMHEKLPLDDPGDTSDSSMSRINRKRLSSDDGDDGLMHTETHVTELLPPSPPPSKNKGTGSHNELNKAVNRTRKKAKISMELDSQDDVEENESDISVIELDPLSLTRRSHVFRDDEERLMREAYGYVDTAPKYELTGVDDGSSLDEEVNIDLQDDLRQLLRISSSSGYEREERALVNSLLNGELRSRNEHGEVWGIGEVDDLTSNITDGEEDWVGEGLPWEAGEL